MKRFVLPIVLGFSISSSATAFGQDDLSAAITDLVTAAVNLPSACEEGDSKCVKREQKEQKKWEKIGETARSDGLKALGQTGGLVKKLEKSGSLGRLVEGVGQVTSIARSTYENEISAMRDLLTFFASSEGNPLDRFGRSIDKVDGKATTIQESFLSEGSVEYGNFIKKSVGVIKGASRLAARIEKFIDKKGLTPPADLVPLGPPCTDFNVECFGDVCRTEVMIAVANNGAGDAGAFVIRVTFDPDAESVDFPVAGLPAGETQIFTITSPEGGNCLDPDCGMQFEIDANGEVLETNEENNSASWNCVVD